MRHPHLENDTDQLNGFEKPFLILKCLTLGPASRPLAEAITSKVEQIGRSWKMEQQKLLRQMKTVGMCGSWIMAWFIEPHKQKYTKNIIKQDVFDWRSSQQCLYFLQCSSDYKIFLDSVVWLMPKDRLWSGTIILLSVMWKLKAQRLLPLLHKYLSSICYMSSTKRLVQLLGQNHHGSETFKWSNVLRECKRALACVWPVCTSKHLLDKSYVTGNAPANKDIRQRSSRGTLP